MTITDPIADLLTRIRNANMVNHAEVEIPASKYSLPDIVVWKPAVCIRDCCT